ncbi:phage holin family protein [Kibdelosporangium philippinense]|uniref:Phage holin family protein n=1 Tax=Kibdelosporangium philippinense TaxID=211113 RepID=A0ABS8ZU74_9PSEU|nr:phage holin family protein [Kibdelosporangium philippinense]MCE7009372.1 phage holin family protein [Kibdelosporangium philippinense]
MTSAQQNDRAGAGLPQVPSIPLTEDRVGLPPGDQSIGALVKDATTHLSTLVRAEMELAKIEIARDVKRGLRGSIFFILALVVLMFSLYFPFIALAEGLAELGLQRWAGFLITWGVMLLVVGLFGFLGYRKVRGIKGPKRTIKTAQETMAALKRDNDEKPAS